MSKSDRNVRAHKKHLKGNRADAGAKKGEFDVEVDAFDETLPINKISDICMLCKGDHFDGELMHKKFAALCGADDDEGESDAAKPSTFLDPEGIWASQYSLKNISKRRSFVHFDCALYAPQISFNGVEWSNIRKEILRGNTLTCYHCHQRGATILCNQPRCNYIVHLPCAIREGFLPSRFVNTSGYYCRIHSKENNEVEKELDKLVAADISSGREAIPVLIKNSVDELAFPQEFEYITSNVDSDLVIATPQNVCSDEFQCCDCVGLCNDVNLCACLRVEFQRNYSSSGKLIPGAERPILECNMRCNCSINRCTNRVVERGLQYPLQLFRRGAAQKPSVNESETNSSSSSAVPVAKKRLRQGSSDDKGWGVMTLENIPEGAFVCELVGQYVDSKYLSQSLNNKIKNILDEDIGDDETARFNVLLENHIMPLTLWGTGMSTGRPSVAAVTDKTIVDVDEEPEVIHIDCEKDAEKEVESDEEDNPIEVTEDTVVEVFHNPVQDPHSDNLLDSPVKKLEDILRGQICIDCNTFGNIARFIRRRKKERKGAKNGTWNSSSSSSQQMLKQKLIFTNAGDRRFPKLALFAAHYIPANTELLI